MKEKDPWIKNFRQRLDNYEEPVPADLWEQLERELQPSPRVLPFARRWQAAAAVALLLVASTLTVWFWQSPSVEYLQQQSADWQTGPSGIHQGSVWVHGGEAEQQDTLMPVALATEPSRLLAAESSLPKVSRPKRMASLAAGVSMASPSASRVSSQAEADEKQEFVENEKQETVSAPASTYRPWYASARSGVQKHRSSERKNWSVGVSAGNGSWASSAQSNGYLPLPRGMNGAVLNNSYGVQVLSEIDKLVQFKNLSEGREPKTDVEYKMPVVWELSFRLDLDAAWAIETGLTYTQLASETRSGTVKNHYGWKDKLHYVGIPVKLHHRFWNNHWLELYASAGGAVEKCVSGERTLTGSVSNPAGDSYQKLSGAKEDLDVDPLQWSLSAAAGVQWKLNERLGLYAEPGVAYYFNDGSEVETIRKEHPFQFNLQLGVRLTFPK